MELTIVAGRNAVYEALCGERSIDSIYLQKGGQVKGVEKILALAKKQGIVVKNVDSKKMDEMAPGINHQGVCALIAPIAFASLEELFEKAESKNEAPFFVLCDEILDPHNLGAIIRTAECAGAHGVIIPKRRSAPISGVVLKTSAGAVEHMPICKVGNISACIDELKERGVWVYCADMDGEDYTKVNFGGGVALVVGSEGKGVSPLVKKNCDVVVSLPLKGKINSLNASVAAGILMYKIAEGR